MVVSRLEALRHGAPASGDARQINPARKHVQQLGTARAHRVGLVPGADRQRVLPQLRSLESHANRTRPHAPAWRRRGVPPGCSDASLMIGSNVPQIALAGGSLAGQLPRTFCRTQLWPGSSVVSDHHPTSEPPAPQLSSPPGLVTFSRRVDAELSRSAPEVLRLRRRSPARVASPGRLAIRLRHSGLRHRLDQVEHISRPAARRAPVTASIWLLVLNPRHGCPTAAIKRLAGFSLLCAGPTTRVAEQNRDPSSHRGRGVGHGAHNPRFGPENVFETSGCSGPPRSTETPCPAIDKRHGRAQPRHPSPAVSPRGQSQSGRKSPGTSAQRGADGHDAFRHGRSRRINNENRIRCSATLDPARHQGAAHLAATDEKYGTGFGHV